jgi:dUTP pyrophosphatase
MQARITRVREGVALPEYKTTEAAGFDVAVAEGGTVPPGGTLMLPTGLVVEAPEGHMLMIVPRSSTFKKKGLRLGNTVGIIDRDFSGPEDELQLFVWNPGTEPVVIEAGERIAQGLFIPITRIEWTEGHARAASRGGWGSTGGYKT